MTIGEILLALLAAFLADLLLDWTVHLSRWLTRDHGRWVKATTNLGLTSVTRKSGSKHLPRGRASCSRSLRSISFGPCTSSIKAAASPS